MSKRKDECIVPGCKRHRYCRGLCTACYFEARRKIKANEVTEAELIRRKLILLTNRTGRPSKNKMARLISSKTA